MKGKKIDYIESKYWCNYARIIYLDGSKSKLSKIKYYCSLESLEEFFYIEVNEVKVNFNKYDIIFIK